MSGLAPVLARLVAGETLGRDEAEEAFSWVLSGEASEAQLGSLLAALALRGETAEELTGAAAAMRERMVRVVLPGMPIDVCGTGGSGLHSLNVSTATAIVLASLSVPVAKHGNRAATSLSGSSDVLSALGVGLVTPERAPAVMAAAGLAFLFAPHHHPALGPLAPVRQALGFRTAFNLLGPLCNPAGVSRQLLGVASARHLFAVAESLALSGADHAWVVRGEDGLDELTVCGPSQVVEVRAGRTRRFEVGPEEAGLDTHDPGALRGGTAADNAAALRRLLGGEPGPYRDAVALNAAAGLIVAGRTAELAEGARMAERALEDGRAATVLDRLVKATNAS